MLLPVPVESSLEILTAYGVSNVETSKGKYEAYKITEIFRVVVVGSSPKTFPGEGRGKDMLWHNFTLATLSRKVAKS